jgi:DNA modification methylase
MNKEVLLFGDCVQLLKIIETESVDLIIAPTLHMLQEFRTKPEKSPVGTEDLIGSQFTSVAQYVNWSRNWIKECARILKPSGCLYVSQNMRTVGEIIMECKTNFPYFHNLIAWKDGRKIDTNTWMNHQQQILCFSKSEKPLFYSDKNESNIWDIEYETLNPEKYNDRIFIQNALIDPEALMEKIILAHTKEGDVVLDPFGGSGTTGAVAKRLNRGYILMEKNQTAYNNAVRRLENTSPVIIEEPSAQVDQGNTHPTA